MDQQTKNESEPTTSSSQDIGKSEGPSNLIRLPKVVLERLDEQTILSLQSPSPSKNPFKGAKKVNNKVNKPVKKSPNTTNDTGVKRGRGRPRKINVEPVLSKFKKSNLKVGIKNTPLISNNKSPTVKKNNLKLGMKNKTGTLIKRPTKESVKIDKNSGKLSKKSMLQKRSKVIIPLAKKTKVTPKKAIAPKSPVEAKPNPPKPKLEIQSKQGGNSSDSSGDEFLYDELIEELENTANKRIVDVKPVPEKTTITLKPNTGNRPPTVLKGGIVKKTDLPSDLHLFAPSNVTNSTFMTNGLQTSKPSLVQTPGGKRKSSDIPGHPGSVKKSSPWPVSFAHSPKKTSVKSPNSQKKANLKSKVGVSQPNKNPTTIVSPKNAYSPFISSNPIPEPSLQSKAVTLGLPKAKIGPKQTAKVVPLSKSLEAEDYLSDEYLEEETLDYDLESEELSKQPQIKSAPINSENQDTDNLLKILTDDPEEPIQTTPNDAIDNQLVGKVDIQTCNIEEKATTQVPANTCLDVTCEQTKDIESDEVPIRTIYDVMSEVFLEYPSWNLHVIPETSAFCIAQVTKGRLGLPTLKKCIELDPVSYSAKVYIHQYHIKRFDGVYDGEESILALIREIDSIKA